MNKAFRKFIIQMKAVRLDSKDKVLIKEVILKYVKENPVRKEKNLRHILQRSNLIFNHFIGDKSMPVIITIVLIAALTGGMSAAAEKALPGDFLHSIKVGINENFKGIFAGSLEAQAKLEIEKADRRLREVEELALKEKLQEKVLVEVKARFKDNIEKSQALALELQAKGRSDAALNIHSDIGAVLEAHEKILTALKSKEGKVKVEIEGVLESVKEEKEEAKEDSEESEERVAEGKGPEVKAAAEGRFKAAENKIKEVSKFIEKKSAKAEANVIVDAEARLKKAQELIAQGKAEIEAKKFNEAFLLFQEAQKTAQEAKVLINVKKDIDIDLNLELK